MKIKVTLTLCLCFSTGLAIAADQCSQSLQQTHQDKFERYMIDEVPSLLESCGLGDLVIDMPSLPSFGGADLFCGFGTNDIMGFYNDHSSNSFSIRNPSNKPVTRVPSSAPPRPNRPIQPEPKPTPVPEPRNIPTPEKKWEPADLFKID